MTRWTLKHQIAAIAAGVILAVPARAQGFAVLSHRDRVRLIKANVAGDHAVTLLIATRPGGVPAVIIALQSLGGVVRFRDDALGYLRARAPIDAVRPLATCPAIEAITVNEEQFNLASASDESTPRQGVEATTPASAGRGRIPPPDSATPALNAYMPVQDVGSPQFIAKHPTYDGRGATVAVVESWGDFSHPTLQDAMTSDGQHMRKVVAFDAPLPDFAGRVRGDTDVGYRASYRVQMRDTALAAHGELMHDGVIYRAPHDGVFRIGVHRNDSFLHGRSVPLLWSPVTGEVWVDALNTHDFTTAPALRDFNVTGDFGWLSVDDPSTPRDDRPPIAVVIHADDAAIDCLIGGDRHTTGVSAVAAGEHIYGGRAHGVAPNARLVWLPTGSTLSGIEDFIRAARRSDVDVVTNQRTIRLRLRDDHSVFGIIMERLATETHKLVFQSAGNALPLLDIVTPSASGVLGITGYVRRDTWWTLYGVHAPKSGYIPGTAGAAGPASDGGFSPFALSPAAYLPPYMLRAEWHDTTHTQSNPTRGRGLYDIPVGYSLGTGTSFAAPSAAGVAALLVSAAKQAHIPYDGRRLETALATGAVLVPGEPAYRQGTGELNVVRAWAVLQRLATLPEPVMLTSAASVRTVLSHELATPNVGRGLFEREGWSAGDTGTRMATLTRVSGSSAPRMYALRWRGNDGTYRSASHVVLGLNAAVAVPVHIAIATAGVHSAELDVIDASETVVHRMMATVVAAVSLDRADSIAAVVSRAFDLRAPFLEQDTRFVRVPAGLDSLAITVTLPTAEDIELSINGPSGSRFQQAGPIHGDPMLPSRYGITRRRSSVIVYPEPGTWELGIANTNDSLQFDRAQSAVNATLTVTGYRSRNPPTGATTRLTFAPADTATWLPVQVDSMAHLVLAHLVSASRSDADLDLYLVNCAAPDHRCQIAAVSTIRGTKKSVAVDGKPVQAGTWRVLVDPVHVPSGGVTVDCIVSSR